MCFMVGCRDRKETDLWRLEAGHWKTWTQMERTYESHEYLAYFFPHVIWRRLVHCAVQGSLLLVQKDI